MISKGILSINEVNAVPNENFEWLFGNVIEYTPEAAQVISTKRPFDSTEALKRAFEDYLEHLEKFEKEQILLRYPDLSGKLSEEAKLEAEHPTPGLSAMSAHEKTSLLSTNNLYKERFRFPFIICPKMNTVKSILLALETRIKNSRDTEVKNAIDEVKKICRLRIDDLVWPDA